ncbi:hypothetical protein [Ornithinimicrobium kibberense]
MPWGSATNEDPCPDPHSRRTRPATVSRTATTVDRLPLRIRSA